MLTTGGSKVQFPNERLTRASEQMSAQLGCLKKSLGFKVVAKVRRRIDVGVNRKPRQRDQLNGSEGRDRC